MDIDFNVGQKVYYMSSNLIREGIVKRKDTIERLDKNTIKNYYVNHRQDDRDEILNRTQLFSSRDKILAHLERNIN